MSWEGWTRFRGPGSVDGVGEKREKGKRFLAGREDQGEGFKGLKKRKRGTGSLSGRGVFPQGPFGDAGRRGLPERPGNGNGRRGMCSLGHPK